jgi:TIR domain
MSDEAIIFISYAREDYEWLRFVRSFLRPDEKDGLFRVWTDRLIKGGADWKPEIEAKLRACDIFILLVSTHSMGSDFIIDKEIAIIRDRQAKGEPVHFYPLQMEPTPDAGLRRVDDKNLRPGRGEPFSGYNTHERADFMTKAADEIAGIARRAMARKSVAGPDLRIDGRTGVKMRFNYRQNPLGTCVELIPKARLDSTYTLFHLMPDLLCGTKREWRDDIYYFFRIKELQLQLKLNGCVIAPFTERLRASYRTI